MQDGKVCEHCLIGLICYSMMGRFQVYECAKGERYEHKDLLAGFYNPCEGYHCGHRKRRDSVWIPHYKRIPQSQMRKSEERIQQDIEDARRRKKRRGYKAQRGNKTDKRGR